MKKYEEMLTGRGVRPTPNRLLVLRALAEARAPMSLADLEEALSSVDKASIFRVLSLFSERDLVHQIEDGSRALKYELCHGGEGHTPADQHVHFHCDACGETYCLEDVAIPAVDLPAGFEARAVNYLIKGLCPRCHNKFQ